MPDQVVSQVGKAVADPEAAAILERIGKRAERREKQSLADQVAGAAVRAISDQGLTVIR